MKRDRQRLQHILKAIHNIELFMTDKSYADLEDDLVLKSAIMAQLMIIGEAANNVSDKVRSKYKEVGWEKIVGLRNILIHEYFGVVWEIVWDTTKKDLPALQGQITDILSSMDK